MSMLSHPRCPFCHDPVAPSMEKTACHACMAWHHAECWGEHGGCATCGLDAEGARLPGLALPATGKSERASASKPAGEDPWPGQTFETDAGRVEVLEPSPHGYASSGRGYRGRLIASDTPCTVWLRELPAPAAARHRLYVERLVPLYLSVKHPNLVQVYAVSYGDVLVQVEEWTPGPTLEELGQQTVAVATRTVGGIARGLEALHLQGGIHRLLKPSMVQVAEDGSPKLRLPGIDPDPLAPFPLTIDGAMTSLATPVYFAPEIGRVKVVDQRVDLYSLGLTYYYLLTGRDALAGFSALEVLSAGAHRQIPSPLERAPELSEAHLRVLGKLLEFDRERRYPDARSLLADLDALEHPQVSAGAPSLWPGTIGEPEAEVADARHGFWGRLFGRSG